MEKSLLEDTDDRLSLSCITLFIAERVTCEDNEVCNGERRARLLLAFSELYSENSENEKERRLERKPAWVAKVLWIRSLLENQKEHYFDWLSVTSTCRRPRDCEKPTFSREKEFFVPPIMPRALRDGKIRSSSFDVATDCIHNIVVPVSSFMYATNFMILPKYHHFVRLSTLTILKRQMITNASLKYVRD